MVGSKHCETLEECHHGEERNVLRNIISRDNVFDRIDSWLEGKMSSALHKLQEEDPSLGVLVKKKVAGEDRPKWGGIVFFRSGFKALLVSVG